jgi:hypothetical protein
MIRHTADMENDVSFRCNACGQWLEAPPGMIGLFVECPTCQAIIKVPAVSEPEIPAPTPKPAADVLGTTMRIDLPPNLGIPVPPRRRFVIRRKDKDHG